MKISILIEGQAGQGPNVISKIIGNAVTRCGYYAFICRDYGSFIRGGRNSNTISISDEKIESNDSKIDVVVSLKKFDEFKWENKGINVIEKEDEENMYFAGRVAKLLGIDYNLMEEDLKKMKNFDENIANVRRGFLEGEKKYELKRINRKIELKNGAELGAEGAVSAGLDVYFAYPMTPATSLLMELASKQKEKNILVLELENEIAVINAALGAAITGAKSMCGSSGGGFDLMTEALSLSGIADIPIVVYLASRPGPATGVATYTSQGDLSMVLGCGHGEFSRVVLAPGTPMECGEMMGEAFYFSQKYKIPVIVMSDKHLAESLYSVEGEMKVVKSEKSTEFGRYNSYESDDKKIATEDLALIKKNAERRIKKTKDIAREAERFEMFSVFGKEDSKNAVLFWGSTKGAVVDAINGLDVKGIQIKWIEPFSEKIAGELKKADRIMIVENNSTAQLAKIVAEKTGILIADKDKILRYDGMPFFADELRDEIKRRIAR